MKKLTFISLVTLTCNFDVALNKRNAGQGYVFCMWLFSCTVLMSLDCQKTVSNTKCYPSITIERPMNLLTLTSAQRITVTIFHKFWLSITL